MWKTLRIDEVSAGAVINKHEMPSTPEASSQVIKQLSTVFPIDFENEAPELPSKQDTFPRNSLILTLPQLIQESYPLPIPTTSSTRETQHFTPTSETYKPAHMGSRMYSIDCEMCEAEGNSQALTKIAVIDEDLNTVYESLVKPKEKIIDYRTRWSGVTNEMLEPVTTTLEDVQTRIREIVSESPDCILIGQSLNCDLKSMRMTHPYVIDTSVIFNLTGVEGRKSKLRDLSLNLLDEEIQKKHKNGHCPVEDSRAAMKLVKKKLATGFSFGNELKNVSQNTIMSFDPALVSSTFKQKKLDKNVTNKLPVSSDSVAGRAPRGPNPVPEAQDNARASPLKQASDEGDEEQLLRALHVDKVNEQVLQSDVQRCVSKLDKRIDRLYSHMLSNSLLVVVSTRQDKSGSDQTRRNNGVCLIRVKSSEVPRRLD
ncbi:RNA exonuclease 1 [Orchesella cincta]|uniref:RNA exonuclease 1 n=1 Tax=Orchesella cincta TaxID=48709 RepID=A0A1D2N211_ORCCI|nr:RNA exonuclease 1 [Orchesella cincta]